MLSQKDRTTAAKPTPEEERGVQRFIGQLTCKIKYNIRCRGVRNSRADGRQRKIVLLSMLVIIILIIVIFPFLVVYSPLALSISWQQQTHYHCCRLCRQEIKCASLQFFKLGGNAIIATNKHWLQKILKMNKSVRNIFTSFLTLLIFYLFLLLPLCFCTSSVAVFFLSVLLKHF